MNKLQKLRFPCMKSWNVPPKSGRTQRFSSPISPVSLIITLRPSGVYCNPTRGIRFTMPPQSVFTEKARVYSNGFVSDQCNMYGLILENMSEFIKQTYGEDKWEEIRRAAAVDQPSFSTHQVYPEAFIPRLSKKAVQVNKTTKQRELWNFIKCPMLK